MKRQFDMRGEASTVKRGTLVCRCNSNISVMSPKFSRPWEGPYVVLERLNNVVYMIVYCAKPKVVHYRLWKCHGDACADWLKEPAE